MEKFRFVVPSFEHEEAALDYINEFHMYNSEINGTGGLDRYLNDYCGWLKKLDSDKRQIPNEARVPALTFFLVRQSDEKIVGMINIRLALNERLSKYGGNIGYCIRPSERRKGYSKINLYLGLLVCQEYGLKEVFLDCDKDNLGSAKTMQSLGGRLVREYFYDKDQCIVQDYIFDVDKSIEDNEKKYSMHVSEFKIK